MFRRGEGWQARRVSNPQPPVLETGALPIELLAYYSLTLVRADSEEQRVFALCSLPFALSPKYCVSYFVSLCPVCFLQKRQYLLNSRRSDDFFRFFVVL